MDEDSDGVIRVEHVNKVKNYNKPITVYISLLSSIQNTSVKMVRKS